MNPWTVPRAIHDQVNYQIQSNDKRGKEQNLPKCLTSLLPVSFSLGEEHKNRNKAKVKLRKGFSLWIETWERIPGKVHCRSGFFIWANATSNFHHIGNVIAITLFCSLFSHQPRPGLFLGLCVILLPPITVTFVTVTSQGGKFS